MTKKCSGNGMFCVLRLTHAQGWDRPLQRAICPVSDIHCFRNCDHRHGESSELWWKL
jgi:hypothetical protein